MAPVPIDDVSLHAPDAAVDRIDLLALNRALTGLEGSRCPIRPVWWSSASSAASPSRRRPPRWTCRRRRSSANGDRQGLAAPRVERRPADRSVLSCFRGQRRVPGDGE